MAAETRTARRPVVLQRHLESGRRSAVPGTAPRLKAVADIANVSVSRSVALMSRADASARTRSARVSGRFGCDERALRRNRRGYRCVRRAPRRMRPDRRCPGLVGSARKRAPAGFAQGFDGQDGPRTASPTRTEANARVTNPQNQGLPTWHLNAPVMMAWHWGQGEKKSRSASRRIRSGEFVVTVTRRLDRVRRAKRDPRGHTRGARGGDRDLRGSHLGRGCSAERARSGWPPRARSGRARGSRRVNLVPRRSR